MSQTQKNLPDGVSFIYQYDGVGNLLSIGKTPCAGCGIQETTTYTYNAANELTSTQTPGNPQSPNYTYDGNGNLTVANDRGALATSVAYNAKNQTMSMTPPGQSAVSFTYTGTSQDQRTKVGSTTFDYDLLGLHNDGTARYLRDNTGQLLGEKIGE